MSAFGEQATEQEQSGVALPIDSVEEAIQHAETDQDVQDFKQDCADEDLIIRSWGKFAPEQRIWIVVFYAVDAHDLWLEVHIEPNGAIILKKSEGG